MADAPAGARLEALVVGGGPGGLATALYLARFRRSVLVIDEGLSRATQIPRTRNYPGFPEGIQGPRLVAAMRMQCERHGVRFVHARVRSLKFERGLFQASWDGGSAAAERATLATGVTDVPPAMPHLSQAVREGALRYCPVCDGYEAIGKHVGLVADDEGDVDEALYLRHFSDQVTAFVVDERVRMSGTQRRRLADAGVVLVEQAVRSISLVDGGVQVRHGDCTTRLDAVYAALGTEVHCELAVELNVSHDERGYLLTDRHQQTSLPGLFAVGDVVKGLNQISVAVGEAAIAASAIHLSLSGRN